MGLRTATSGRFGEDFVSRYVQTDPNCKPRADYWYTKRSLGKNTLEGYIEDMMKKGD